MEKDILRLEESSQVLEPNFDERNNFENKVWSFLNNSCEELPNQLAWNVKSKLAVELPIGQAKPMEDLLKHFNENVLKNSSNMLSSR